MSQPLPWDKLLDAAARVREQAYAPYSNFLVGAAALFDDGTIVPGCNVENSSYGLSVCAERNAIGRGVAEGRRKLVAIAVVADSEEPCPPCGTCRQVIREFAAPDVPVRCRNLEGKVVEHTVGELLPHAFTRDFL